MRGMSVPPEQVEVPAGDAVLFRSSPVRTFTAVSVVVALVYLAVTPLVDVLLGNPAEVWWRTAIQGAVTGLVVAGALTLAARSSLSTWVRVSGAGLELAAQGSDPVLLAWADIAHVVVRRAGVRTILEVTPVALDRVHPVDAEGPGWPTMGETAHGTAFVADVTQIWPGPRTLRRELARRL